MKTIKILSAVLLLSSGFMLNAQNVKVNTEKSTLKWLGKKVGGEHFGEIQLKSGEMELKGENILSGNFVIDMTSITNADVESEEYNQKLVGHLKSDDFFGTESFPTSSLKLTKVAEFLNGKAIAQGDLTIKGKTNPISFEIKKEMNNYLATIIVDRSKYDVRYGSKSFFDNLGDKYINDEFTLEVIIVTE
ncbi:MAG: YceI family protein [Bacteroidales bacterium]|nr:YceI family protein [Bacteroidales bacterium]MCF8391204.1 YceI family protein [Bacteroidales bacterium]